MRSLDSWNYHQWIELSGGKHSLADRLSWRIQTLSGLTFVTFVTSWMPPPFFQETKETEDWNALYHFRDHLLAEMGLVGSLNALRIQPGTRITGLLGNITFSGGVRWQTQPEYQPTLALSEQSCNDHGKHCLVMNMLSNLPGSAHFQMTCYDVLSKMSGSASREAKTSTGWEPNDFSGAFWHRAAKRSG